jgi:hypothetical protein
MTDTPENLVLVYLRRIDEKVDRLIDRVQEATGRVGLLEAQYASVSRRLDQLEIRLDRIERRLDLTPVP